MFFISIFLVFKIFFSLLLLKLRLNALFHLVAYASPRLDKTPQG